MRFIVLGIVGWACAAAGSAGAAARPATATPDAVAPDTSSARARPLPSTEPPSSDSLAVVKLERTWLETSDTAVLARILAPRFVHVTPGGYVLTRAQHLAWVAAHPRRPGVRRRFGSLRVRLYGDAAIANGIVIASDPAGRQLRRTAVTDVFVKRGGRWLAVNAQEDVVSRRGGGR